MDQAQSKLAEIVAADQPALVQEWVELQKRAGAAGSGRIGEQELRAQCRDFRSEEHTSELQSH
mgnify:CR=1 FL=1